MKKISLKSMRRMEQDALRGKWYNLIELKRIPEFSAWLTDDFHGWQSQSPDVGEVLRLYRDGTTLIVYYDGRRTICGRHAMALWHTFLEFHDNVFGEEVPDSVSAIPDSVPAVPGLVPDLAPAVPDSVPTGPDSVPVVPDLVPDKP